MTRYLLTLNMPANSGALIQQITVDHPAKTLAELCKTLNENLFIVVRLWYHQDRGVKKTWEDRGDQILNTEIIGKAQLYVDRNGTPR